MSETNTSAQELLAYLDARRLMRVDPTYGTEIMPDLRATRGIPMNDNEGRNDGWTWELDRASQQPPVIAESLQKSIAERNRRLRNMERRAVSNAGRVILDYIDRGDQI